jgi:drug/metabolite transporter (DMT)-like permease
MQNDMRWQNTSALGLVLAPLFVGQAGVLAVASGLDPFSTVFWRLGIAALVLVLFAMTAWWRSGWPPKSVLVWSCVAGALFAIDLALFHMALTEIPVATATLLNNLAPVFAAVISIAIGQPILRRHVACLVAALVGLLFFAMPSSGALFTGWGFILGVGSAIAFSAYYFAVGKARKQGEAPEVAAIVAIVGAILLCCAPLWEQRGWPDSTIAWGAVIALGIIVHCLGIGLSIHAARRFGPPTVSAVMMLQPVAASVSAAAFLGQQLPFVSWVGLMITATSIAALTLAPRVS